MAAMGTLRWISVCGLAACVATSMSACLTATQVVVEIQTNVDCSIVRARGVVLRAGRDATLVKGDEAASRNVYYDCAEATGNEGFNAIGTISLSPEAAKDAKFAVSALIGINKKAEECQRAVESETDGTSRERFPGCVFTWRSSRFLEQTGLRMRMVLYVECKDVACQATQFCGAGAKCYAGAVPAEECKDTTGGCIGEPPRDSPGVNDGGIVIDGSGGSSSEGGSDGGSGSPNAPSGAGNVACGADTCTRGPCCAVGNGGGLMEVCQSSCAVGTSTCDEVADCSPGKYCLVAPSGYGARICGAFDPAAQSRYVCYRDVDCPGGKTCSIPVQAQRFYFCSP
jgi:hypothetical protein